MTHTRKNQGVCSRSTTVELENGVIQNISVEAGCDGNLKGLCSLLKGQDAGEAICRMEGICCDNKATSCPDQIAQCLKEAVARQG